MTLLWPELLWLAALLPLLVLLYAVLLRRRRKVVLRHPAVALLKQAAAGPGWRRHLPPALMLLALAVVILAGARPTVVLTLPTQQKTVILAMDVSGSMRATDVAPDRISASQAAAKTFVKALPRGVRIGVVAYGGSAQLVQPPTPNREDVSAAIDRIKVQPGTAIGSGIIVALATIFPDAGIDLSSLPAPREAALAPRSPDPERSDQGGFVALAPGAYESAAIVLLTDGQNTVGPAPMDAAQLAANRGVKVFTVGFGTKEGEVITFEGWSMRVKIDEDTLKNVANLTHGEYFYAGSGTDLKKVYETLRSRLVLERRETEVTALFGYLAGLLMLVAAALSTWWFGRIA